MLHLVGHHTETKRMLKLSNTPRLARDDLLMARAEQQQIRQHGDAKGLLNPSLLPTSLVFTQSQVGLEFSIDVLDVIVTTHKTIALVFHTQVYKLKRDMT